MDKLSIEKILSILAAGGPLSKAMPGFEAREQQKEMLCTIADSFNRNLIALIEAGTGTGKSLAYLIPSILWSAITGEKVLISTNTINLQEQLLHKDIPLVAGALNLSIKAVLVKGMSNYLCLRKMAEIEHERHFFTPPEIDELDRICAWSAKTKEGSRATLDFSPTGVMWEKVCAEQDTCSNAQCPHYRDCYFFKARERAQDAQILVSNHHLLFADVAARVDSENFDEPAILPPYKRVVIDEAHHIEDVATDFFADQLSWMGMLRILARIASEKQGKVQGKLPVLKQKLEHHYGDRPPLEVTSLLNRLENELPTLRKTVFHLAGEAFSSLGQFMQRVNNKDGELSSAGENKLRMLPIYHSHPSWSGVVLPKVQQLIEEARRYMQALSSMIEDLKSLKHEKLREETSGLLLELSALTNKLKMSIELMNQFIFLQPAQTKVRWIEQQLLRTMVNINLVDADLDISYALVEALFSKFSTVVLCSATLTTNKQFSFVRERLGLTDKHLPDRVVTENIYDPPFDYVKQALLAIPNDLPPPDSPRFLEAAVEAIWIALQASRGCAFVLFTSYAMLKTCYEKLESRLKDARFNLFKQGDDNRQKLLKGFKESQRSVLFGTDSFWEGVDVSGEALRCVIIVKLPFRVPSEPIVQARVEAIVEAGGEPFKEYTLPMAIVKFKQGFGRLIRHKKDRGCIICLDTRLLNKHYGKVFLNSLPACQQAFIPLSELHGHMQEFYRKTHYMTV